MRNSSEFLTFLTVPLCCCKLLLCDGHMTNKLLLHHNTTSTAVSQTAVVSHPPHPLMYLTILLHHLSTTSTDVSQYAVASHPPQPLMYHILFLHNGLNKQIAVAPQPPITPVAVIKVLRLCTHRVLLLYDEQIAVAATATPLSPFLKNIIQTALVLFHHC